jgi:hypothetical protein
MFLTSRAGGDTCCNSNSSLQENKDMKDIIGAGVLVDNEPTKEQGTKQVENEHYQLL